MFLIQSRGGGSVAWRQAETVLVDEPTGSYAPRGKWSAGGRGFRARAYSHVSEGASSGANNLSATGITTGEPTLGSPVLDGTPGAVDLLGVGTTTGAPTLGNPAIGQTHVLAAVGITTGAPVVGIAPPSGGPAVLGSLRGTKKRNYPQRPPNKQTGYRY